ncbi:MAG: PKD domain-containing protein, partial [Anaerolineae bacterium]
MLDEICASTQPGWTTGANNNLYDSNGLTTSTQTPPTNIGTLDPAVNTAPTADPNGPYTGEVDVPVNFDGSGSSDPENDPLTYAWDFGDGGTATGVGPSHTYTSANTYTVTLTVNDGELDSDPATTTATITVGNQPPTADPNGPYIGTVGSPVAFDGSDSSDPDGDLLTYAWNFGDGATGTGV